MVSQTFWEIYLADHYATQVFGHQLGKKLPANSVILLCGDLGAGKTTFVQGLGEGLGITIPIVSPTFTLINEYLDGRIPLYHLDLYRLEKQGAIAQLFPEIYWEGKEVTAGITAIEWAEKLPYLPASYLKIELMKTEESRLAKIEVNSDSLQKILAPILHQYPSTN